MQKPLTLIVVTLAVVGSVVEYLDPAVAVAQPPSSEYVLSDQKLQQIEGLDKTLASESSKQKVTKTKVNVQPLSAKPKTVRNTVSIDIELGTPDTNKIYAKWYIQKKHNWNNDQFQCLNKLWTHESGWLQTSKNSSSGAYGIPQSLPADKMASAGDDWKTNPATQIHWGVNYINDRYGTPCAAYAHFTKHNWY